MWTLLLASVWMACAPVDPDGADTGSSDTGNDTGSDTASADTHAPPADPSDEDVLRGLFEAASPDPEAALTRVAWSDGLPVHTASGTWLFVALADGEASFALAGDFNAWTPEPMNAGDGFFWAEVTLSDPAGSRYKFTDGSSWQADPWARAYEYDDNGAISFVAPPVDRPRMERWPRMEGQGLRDRDVHALVPPGVGPWPVVYAHDGQNLFDPGAIWGGWRMQDAVGALDAPLLVVGIANTPNRLSEYAHTDDEVLDMEVTGRADAYAAFVHDRVIPHVEARYATAPHRAVLGSSMGGLASLYIAHAYPDAFDLAASLSGTLGWGRFSAAGPVMQELYEGAGVGQTVLYVDSGGGDGGDGCTDPDGDGFFVDDPNHSDNYCTNRQFADAMAALGYTWDVDLFHWHEAGASHNEAAWAARVHRPLELFLDLIE